MNRRWFSVGLVLFAFLASGIQGGGLLAADSKDKLPKAGAANQPAKPKPPAQVQEKSGGRSDSFVDKDGNGVDDRRETRVMRPENTPPPAVKQDPKPAEAPPSTPPTASPARDPKEPAPKPPAASPPGR
jgi:hypothetical protein